MNVTEATHVQTVLKFLLADDAMTDCASAADATHAARVLADLSRHAVGAGMVAGDVPELVGDCDGCDWETTTTGLVDDVPDQAQPLSPDVVEVNCRVAPRGSIAYAAEMVYDQVYDQVGGQVYGQVGGQVDGQVGTP